MKVLHLPYTFYPDAVGGTEIYVEALAQAQRRVGVEAIVAAPGARETHYEHAGLAVWRFPIAAAFQDVREMYGEGDTVAAEGFGRVLDVAQPDLVHVHAFTPAVSLRVIRSVKRRGIPVVFSYHTPTVSCQRGTLQRWGSEVCDGTLDVQRCASCAVHAAGLNRLASRVVGSLPAVTDGLLGGMGLTGGMWTALRMPGLVALRHAAFGALMAEVDHVVALCEWVKQVLLRNHVPAEKITVCRQGLVQNVSGRPVSRAKGGGLRMVFLGRLDPTKGVHILLDALRSIRDLDVSLDIYGVAQGQASVDYLKRLKSLAGGDTRIKFLAPVAAQDVVSTLGSYDVAVVPSQWLETGPMVVLEAFAARLPVIGSDLGGIAELVRHGVDGLLIPSRSVSAWADALRGLSSAPETLAKLRSNIRPPRRIAEAAVEIDRLYRRFVPAHSYA